MRSNEITDARLQEMIAEQNRWLAMEFRDELVALINTYNEASAPYVMRTEAEHAECRIRAKIARESIRRDFIEGVDYKELSNGMLWPISE